MAKNNNKYYQLALHLALAVSILIITFADQINATKLVSGNTNGLNEGDAPTLTKLMEVLA